MNATVCDKRDTVLSYRTLTGPEFNEAMSGIWHDDNTVTSRWLKSPRLHYFMQRSPLIRSPDKRTLFLCLRATAPDDNDGDEPLLETVGMLELEGSPYEEGVVWLKYITVHPNFQRRGVAKELLARMVTHLKVHPGLLSRSKASEEGALKIQGSIDRLLDSNGIRWTQTGRDDAY
jgi:GNAT superfamily N-acetyltransferase